MNKTKEEVIQVTVPFFGLFLGLAAGSASVVYLFLVLIVNWMIVLEPFIEDGSIRLLFCLIISACLLLNPFPPRSIGSALVGWIHAGVICCLYFAGRPANVFSFCVFLSMLGSWALAYPIVIKCQRAAETVLEKAAKEIGNG